MRQAAMAAVILGLVFLLAQAALAADYQIDITPLHNAILPNESASFKLVISNFGNDAQYFQIYTFDTKWVLRIDPTVYDVGARSSKVATIYVKPKTGIGFGSQGVPVSIKHLNDNVVQRQNLLISVLNPDAVPGTYAASVELAALLPQSVDPRQPLRMTVRLRNRNALNISGMEVDITSPLFNRTFTTALAPLAEKSEEQVFDLNPHQAPGTYPMNIALTYHEKRFSTLDQSVVIPRIEDVQEHVSGTAGFFRSQTTVALENVGNVHVDHITKLPTNWVRRIFSSATPKATVQKIGGQRYFVWNVSLEPEGTARVTLVENYRLLVIIVLLALVAAILYYVMRSPLIAVKESISLKDGEETSSLKVRIFLKNRTGKQLEAVGVLDRIPRIASYVPKESLGVVSPTKVVKSKKGTMLKWELDLLEPYEERILSYNLTSKLKIVGRVRLPSAKAQFTTKGGKERITYTKNVSFEE